ncbi:hypothetical protein KKF84_21360, partial [Myxococcota bacterium]|nr:hypothetical protein [Myxococcota bacterium]
TPPGSCLPGEDQVHFEKFSAATYEEDSGNSEEKDGDVEINPPMWFRYQTVKVHRVDYGEFHLISLELDTLEQDFSVPGPYGH